MRTCIAARRGPTLILALLISSSVLVGCSRKPGRIEIDVAEGPNPWTHLNLHNNPDSFQFAIVADRNGERRPGIFSRAVEKLNVLQPEFVMCVGDLIGGYTEDVEALDRQWDQFDDRAGRIEMPFFYLVGNHDVTNQVQQQQWRQRHGRLYYHFLYRDVLFLCLDSEDPPRAGGADSIGPEQLEYFREVLEDNRDVRWTLVFLHKPMWLRLERGEGWNAFEGMLGDRQYTVFAGHDHRYLKTVRNGRNHYVLATTGGGSELRGIEAGEFDHIVWVTMTEGVPRIVNLLLDGILDDSLNR